MVLVVCNASKGKEEKAEERVVRDGRRGEEPRADVDKPSQSSHIKFISYGYNTFYSSLSSTRLFFLHATLFGTGSNYTILHGLWLYFHSVSPFPVFVDTDAIFHVHYIYGDGHSLLVYQDFHPNHQKFHHPPN